MIQGSPTDPVGPFLVLLCPVVRVRQQGPGRSEKGMEPGALTHHDLGHTIRSATRLADVLAEDKGSRMGIGRNDSEYLSWPWNSSCGGGRLISVGV